jgi:four helix bundle suffix protein
MKTNRTNKTDSTKKAAAGHSSPASSSSSPGFIPPHGGYENLLAYRKSQIIYDATIRFCDRFIETRPAEVVANILICLIHQANYLLDQLLRKLEQEFLQAGGLRERMTRARLAARAAQTHVTRPLPPCP